jgi:hypothetical protein
MNLSDRLKAMFQLPSAEALAREELEEAKRELLLALSAREYASALVQYNTDRVNRLSKVVSQ